MSLLSKTPVQTFLAGTLLGLSVGLIIMVSNKDPYRFHRKFRNIPFLLSGLHIWLAQQSDFMASAGYYGYYDFQSLSSPKTFDFVGEHSKNDTHHTMLNSSLADQLYGEIKILCWVMTGPRNHYTKAQHVKATWGRRCNKLIFMSSEEDSDLPTVALPVREGRRYLWVKTKEAMKYVYKNYYNEYDWFFKADDDTYAVMENLRYMLYYRKPSDPVYYGCRLKGNDEDYMSGGAGYVLSKEALKRFITEALPNGKICRRKDTGDEDVELGKCLRAVGVKLGDSLDDEYRHRFTPLFVNSMLIPGILNATNWYMSLMYNSEKQGFSCCSDNLITTHYVTPNHMYLLEYLIYHVTPFGISYQPTLRKRRKSRNFKYYSRLGTTGGFAVTEEETWNDFD